MARSESSSIFELDPRSPSSSQKFTEPSPARAEINRERSISRNPPPTKTVRQSRGKNNLKNVSVFHRLQQFPRESFVQRDGRLFCNACREFVSTKGSTVKSHVSTAKHKLGKQSLEKSKLKEQSIREALSKHDEVVHPKGEKLQEELRVFRVEVIEAMLRGGIPLSKLDVLRPLLEKHGFRLTDRSHMAELIPFLLDTEVHHIKKEVSPSGLRSGYRAVSLIFDGSTRLGEAIAVILRFVDEKWNIQQRLVRIDVVAKSVTGVALAQVLNECLSMDFQIRADKLLAVMRDGASVNSAAIERLRGVFPHIFDVVCFSHTLDNVGKRFLTPTLDAFGQYWIRLMSTSTAAKLRWKELTGSTPKRFSETRWWSRWEVYQQLLAQFGDISLFLDFNQDIAPKLSDHLRGIIEDEEQVKLLRIELAVTIDVGKHFVTATYDLEGDGPLVLSCYERLQRITHACTAQPLYLPNLRAVVNNIVENNPEEQELHLLQQGRQCVQGAINWFLRKFNVELEIPLRAFKAARLMDPLFAQQANLNAATLEQLRIFPFFNSDEVLQNLAEELPAYAAAAEGMEAPAGADFKGTAEAKLQFWQRNAAALPHWADAVQKVVLVQPSSAASERVFSILKSCFHEQQDNALTDYLQAAVMLRYNHRG